MGTRINYEYGTATVKVYPVTEHDIVLIIMLLRIYTGLLVIATGFTSSSVFVILFATYLKVKMLVIITGLAISAILWLMTLSAQNKMQAKFIAIKNVDFLDTNNEDE